MMPGRLPVSKARGRCPLDPRQRRSLWNPVIGFWEWGAVRALRPHSPPLPKPQLMGSKGSALSGGSRGAKPPWPYLLTGARA